MKQAARFQTAKDEALKRKIEIEEETNRQSVTANELSTNSENISDEDCDLCLYLSLSEDE